MVTFTQPTRRWQWERVVIMLALLVGVVAMHALVMPMGEDHAIPAIAAPAPVSVPLPAVGPAAVSVALRSTSTVQHALAVTFR
jgi:hypothetical protein